MIFRRARHGDADQPRRTNGQWAPINRPEVELDLVQRPVTIRATHGTLSPAFGSHLYAERDRLSGDAAAQRAALTYLADLVRIPGERDTVDAHIRLSDLPESERKRLQMHLCDVALRRGVDAPGARSDILPRDGVPTHPAELEGLLAPGSTPVDYERERAIVAGIPAARVQQLIEESFSQSDAVFAIRRARCATKWGHPISGDGDGFRLHEANSIRGLLSDVKAVNGRYYPRDFSGPFSAETALVRVWREAFDPPDDEAYVFGRISVAEQLGARARHRGEWQIVTGKYAFTRGLQVHGWPGPFDQWATPRSEID